MPADSGPVGVRSPTSDMQTHRRRSATRVSGQVQLLVLPQSLDTEVDIWAGERQT